MTDSDDDKVFVPKPYFWFVCLEKETNSSCYTVLYADDIDDVREQLRQKGVYSHLSANRIKSTYTDKDIKLLEFLRYKASDIYLFLLEMKEDADGGWIDVAGKDTARIFSEFAAMIIKANLEPEANE